MSDSTCVLSGPSRIIFFTSTTVCVGHGTKTHTINQPMYSSFKEFVTFFGAFHNGIISVYFQAIRHSYLSLLFHFTIPVWHSNSVTFGSVKKVQSVLSWLKMIQLLKKGHLNTFYFIFIETMPTHSWLKSYDAQQDDVIGNTYIHPSFEL